MPTKCPKCGVMLDPSGNTHIAKTCATCQQTEEIRKTNQRREIQESIQRQRAATSTTSYSTGGGGGGGGSGAGVLVLALIIGVGIWGWKAIDSESTSSIESVELSVSKLKSDLADVDATIESERRKWKEAQAVINKLTNNRKTPVRQDSPQYYRCAAAQKVIEEVEAGAASLRSKKAKLEAEIMSLESEVSKAETKDPSISYATPPSSNKSSIDTTNAEAPTPKPLPRVAEAPTPNPLPRVAEAPNKKSAIKPAAQGQSKTDSIKLEIAKLQGQLAEVETKIEGERARWKNASAVINKLTNYKRTPVRQGSPEYHKCMTASKIIKEVEAGAPSLKAKKAKLKATIKSLEDK